MRTAVLSICVGVLPVLVGVKTVAKHGELCYTIEGNTSAMKEWVYAPTLFIVWLVWEI